jgi:hypothetical protein
MVPSALASRVVSAYGGEELWRAARTVEVEASAHGLLFTAKVRHGFDRGRAQVEVASPRARFIPREWAGKSAVLEGHDVRIEDAAGNVLASRPDARRPFPWGRRLLRWDDLDLGYFAGYAFWNYLSFPALLLRSDIAWRELGPGLLEARFPPALPTHSTVQRFHIDSRTGLLRRHDYTADVVGPFARAAHEILAHDSSDGIPFPSHRRVRPRIAGQPLGPTIVDLRIHVWTLHQGAPNEIRAPERVG